MVWVSLCLLLVLLASSHAQESATVTVCRQTTDDVMTKVGELLHKALLAGGALGALPTCAGAIDSLCESYSRGAGLSVERVTLRRLKDQNRTKTYEYSLLRTLRERAKADPDVEEWSGWADETKKRFVYLRAIKIRPVCLQCHGPSEMVLPAVRTAMDEEYDALPWGKMVGETKGALMVDLRFPEAERLVREAEAGEE